MRIILSLALYAGLLSAIGCGGGGKIPITEATAEQIQQQKEAESRVKAEESEMLKNKPKEMTHQKSVDEQERARHR